MGLLFGQKHFGVFWARGRFCEDILRVPLGVKTLTGRRQRAGVKVALC